MRKLGIAGAFALALMSSSPAWSQAQTGEGDTSAAHIQGLVDARLVQLKMALRLRPDQERLWPPVEAAIRRAVMRHNAQESQSNGFVNWVGTKARAAAGEAMSIKRAIAASRPLIRTLDPEQRREALDAARAMGFGSLASAL